MKNRNQLLLGLFYLWMITGCSKNLTDKNLLASIQLPSELATLTSSSLALTLYDSVGLTPLWGPEDLSATEGGYEASLGTLEAGDYMAEVALTTARPTPQLAGLTTPQGATLSLASDTEVTLGIARKAVVITTSGTVQLSLTPADFAIDLDPDLDGLTSLSEYQAGLDPLNSDSDGDGFLDSTDAFPLNLSEFGDSDTDGVGDVADNCITQANAGQENFDQDAKGDACDSDDDNDALTDDQEATLGTNPRKSDHDEDGLKDGADNCPLVANADQADTDLDGSGNACDADDDNDTVADGADNCPLVANLNQQDSDKNGEGDACTGDDDGDSVADGADNCPSASNTDQTNTDSDAQGNACDLDDDNDGLADTEETGLGVDHLITLSLVADTDGDGVSDSADNCPLIVNLTQTDTDGDGSGDLCDCVPNDATIRIKNGIFASVSGNDAHSGAQNAPVKTITKAIALAAATDSSVYVTAGSYQESVALVSGVSLLGGFTPGTSCLRNTVTQGTTITSEAENTLVARDITANTSVHGLTLVNNNTTATNGSATVLITATTAQSSAFVRLEQNQIFGANGADVSYGVKIENTSPLLINNVIFSGEAFSGTAVQLKNSPSARFFHNTLRGGTAATESVAVAVEALSSTFTLVNNVLTTDLGSTDQRLVVVNTPLTASTIIKGNLLQGTGGGSSPKFYWEKKVGGQLLTTIDSFNALDPNGVLEGDGVSDNLTTTGDPATLFVDYGGHDYHLATGSAAIGTGLDPSAFGVPVANDLEGTVRVGFDLGAYEK